MKKRSLPILLFFAALCSTSYGQYCTPTITTGGVYFIAIHYNLPGFTSGVTGGTEYNSGSQGYADNSAVAAGTVNRNCYVGIPFNVYNPSASAVPINVRVFADWNADNDFDDPGETVVDWDYNLNGLTSVGTGAGWINVPNALSSVRVRWAVRQGGSKATSCGGFTGEIEDYTLNFNANTAPAINPSATAFINSLKESQTNNEGVAVQQLFASSLTGGDLGTDANNCFNGGFAVTSTSGSNGQWQFKIGAGAWTNFGAVSTTNALLLSPDNSSPSVRTRVRFLPTGPGTSGFDYQIWDRSTDANGQYVNVTSAGGATAYSTGTASVSMTTYSTAATTSDVNVYMASLGNAISNIYNIHSSSLTRSSGILKEVEPVTSDDVTGYANDIDIDNTNNKLVWVGGSSGAELVRSNMDGSGIESLNSSFGYPTGVGVSNSKIFVLDYGAGIYSLNLDGSGYTAITGGAGQANDINATGDLEYSGNKIYYVNSPDGTNYNIIQANTDGTGSATLYTSTNVVYGLSVTGTTVYWTEMDGSNNASVKSKLISGGGVTNLVTEAGQYYYDVFADETNSKIYITSVEAPSFIKSRIKSIPLAGGSTTRLLNLEDFVPAITFKTNLITLPVHFINIKASRQDARIDVEWNVGQEDNLLKYVVEHSADGQSFTAAGSASATGRNSYTWPDMQPFAGKNYYRIKAVNIDGSVQYSSIVLVNTNKNEPAAMIYPTVVVNQQFTLRLDNAVAGTYRISAINGGGEQVYMRSLSHTGGSSVQTISLPHLPAGIYRIRIAGENQSWTRTIIIK